MDDTHAPRGATPPLPPRHDDGMTESVAACVGDGDEKEKERKRTRAFGRGENDEKVTTRDERGGDARGWRVGGQRAREGFERVRSGVKSGVARSIARRVATRDTTRLRRLDLSIAPIERARSNVGGVARARVREPKNANGGGFHASGALGSWRHAPAPLALSLPLPTPLPDAAASFGAFFSTVVQPSSTIPRVSTERAVAAKRRFRLVRRLRGGREGTATTTRSRSLESRVASTRRRVPGCVYRARGRSRTRTPNAVARANDCAFGRRRHSFYCA